MSWMNRLVWPGWGGLLEIAVLACLIYFVFVFFRGTRSAQVLTGLVLLLIALIGLTKWLDLEALNWLLRRMSVYLTLALLIIFQPEIRRALAELGRHRLFGVSAESWNLVDAVTDAVMLLAERRVGALIAIERKIGTRAIQETGVRQDARVNAELLASIFFPHTPLHDGGVIIRGNRIVAAGCLFPLAQTTDISRGLGTRHRAAMGLSEETDAIVIVVSEETGTVSVSSRGRLIRDFDRERLRRFLSAVLGRERAESNAWQRARAQLNRGFGDMSNAADLDHEDLS